MYVEPSHRGQGLGRAILAFLEAQAAANGCKHFALETGFLQPEALRLYKAAGYEHCPPFGSYTEDPNSVFMHKRVG
jgi:putative acetyltransferase